MSEEPHAVVRLLLKRIESHPEEFKRGRYRWADIVKEVDMFGFDADTGALDAALRDVRLTEAHEEMMEELLNGEDRRRMEAEYESSMAISQLQQLQLNTSHLNAPITSAATSIISQQLKRD